MLYRGYIEGILFFFKMVTCGLCKHLPRIQQWRQHGFAVVMLDNRGSANRGQKFEAYLKVII